MNKLLRFFLAYFLTGAIFLPTAAKVFHEFICDHDHNHNKEVHFEETVPSCDYLLFHFSPAYDNEFRSVVLEIPNIDQEDRFIDIVSKSDTYRYSFQRRGPPSCG